MSDRGLFLALQRLHEDPGFSDRVAQDPDNTIGLYDLDENEREAIMQAVVHGEHANLNAMATKVGMDWGAVHVPGIGALRPSEVSLEGERLDGVHRAGALAGDGYEGVRPTKMS